MSHKNYPYISKCTACGEQYTSYIDHLNFCSKFTSQKSTYQRPVPGYSREAPLLKTGSSEYQSRYTFNQDAKGSSAQNRSRSSAPTSKPNKVPIVQPTFQRSLMVQEFGTENKHGHLNCFLNVCLQALWQFPKVRADLQFMIDNREAAGSRQIKPFINSLQDFYKQIITINSKQSTVDVPIVKSNNVRAELFKLNYSRNEFSLHEKADAFEALDHILTLIHLWQKSIGEKDGAEKKLTDAARLFCDEGEPCFIHQSFGQSSVSQELCTCTKRSAVRSQDPNVFAYSINVPDLLTFLPRFKLSRKEEDYYRSVEEEAKRVFATKQKLVTALKQIQTQEREGCAEDPSRKGHHQTKTISQVETNPEVFIFNASWGENPTPSQIFKFMISLPERFKSNEIYDDNPEDTYILRGFFAFQGAHYISFFRRVFMKIDYLPVSDFQKMAQIHKMMEAEVTSRTEWTIFDDSVIDHRGGWHDVVKQCVDIRMYPTVIFYEKLDPNENHPEPLDTGEVDDRKILAGFKNSKEADYNYGVSGGFGAEYDDSQIAEQLELMKQFNNKKEKEKGVEDVKSTSIRVEQEETKVVQPKITQPTSTKPLTLPDLKKKYQEYGIYLFQCNKCEDGIFALHCRNCLKPGCRSENHFVQENVCTDLGKWSECFRAILSLRNWKIEPLLKPSAQPAPELNLSGQTLIAGRHQTENEESKVSKQNKPPLQPPSNKISQSQLFTPAQVQDFTSPEQEKINLTLQGHLNQTRVEDTQDLNIDQKTAQVEQTKDDDNAEKTDTQKEVRNEEAKAMDLSFLQQSVPIEPEEESKFQYPKIDGDVTPGNPAILLKKDFANIGRPYGQQDIQHNQEQRVNQSLTHQNLSNGQDDRLAAGSVQEETKGNTDKSSQRDPKNQTNQAAGREAFERQESEKRDREKIEAESSSDDVHFEDELAGDDKTNIQNMSESLAKQSMKSKGKPIHESIQTQLDLKEQETSQDFFLAPESNKLETFSTFKCPVHKTYTDLSKPCETCGKTIDYYESIGHSFDGMIFEMTQEQLLEIIQEKEDQKKQAKQKYLNTSQPSVGSNFHRQVIDKTQQEPLPYWKCKGCHYTNEMKYKICTGCGRSDTFKGSQHTDIPQPGRKPIQPEVVAKDPKTQKNRNEPWDCLKCNYHMPYYADSCYMCRIKKTDHDRIYVGAPQQPQNKEENKYQLASNCAECGKPKESVSLSTCIECMSKIAVPKKEKCVQCHKEERFKHYERCKNCRMKNLQNGTNVQYDKKNPAEQDGQYENQVKQTELLARQREEQELRAKQTKCPNCSLSKENPSHSFCDDCTCRQCKKEVIYKQYDHCYACLVLKSKAEEEKLQKKKLEEIAVEQEKERRLKESQAAEENKKKNEALLVSKQQNGTNCSNCGKFKSNLSPLKPICNECICYQCFSKLRYKTYKECLDCLNKNYQEAAKQEKLKRQIEQEKVEEEKRKAEEKFQREANELKRKQEAEQRRKELICGVCGNAKASRDQKLCTSCSSQANQLKTSFEQKICFNCRLRPALKETHGSMCSECTDEFKRKYQCPGCGAKKAENQDKCSECGQKQLQDSSRRVSVVCTICKKNPRFEKHNICHDCIFMKPKSQCKRCEYKEAQLGRDYCAHCEQKVGQQPQQKECKKCGTDIYTTEERELCNLCVNLCSCGLNQLANGERQCFVCSEQQVKESKKKKPSTASLKTSQASKIKFIKCPRCVNKNMQVSEVPKGSLVKIVKCNFCTFSVPVQELCSYNKITDLSQKRFVGWIYEETKQHP